MLIRYFGDWRRMYQALEQTYRALDAKVSDAGRKCIGRWKKMYRALDGNVSGAGRKRIGHWTEMLSGAGRKCIRKQMCLFPLFQTWRMPPPAGTANTRRLSPNGFSVPH